MKRKQFRIRFPRTLTESEENVMIGCFQNLKDTFRGKLIKAVKRLDSPIVRIANKLSSTSQSYSNGVRILVNAAIEQIDKDEFFSLDKENGAWLFSFPFETIQTLKGSQTLDSNNLKKRMIDSFSDKLKFKKEEILIEVQDVESI